MEQKWLKAIEGGLKDRVFSLRGRVVIGRGDDADIQIEDPQLSRQHACVFERDDGQMMIADLSSTNGTWVSGVTISQQRLEEGDIFAVGSSRFLYVAGPCPGEVDGLDQLEGQGGGSSDPAGRAHERAFGEGVGQIGTVADVGSMVKMLRHRAADARRTGCGDPLHHQAVACHWQFCPVCGEKLSS